MADTGTSPAPESSRAGSSPLPERDQRILEFERTWWTHAGAKEQAIRSEFGLSAARYYQLVNALLDSPVALAFDPMLIRRLQRVRDTRTAARAARLLPPGE
ncbi:hypothetical protein B7R54_12660 [Subtercola boreus]|uniref:DUF3263 domain-containing protein n=1 Tax=Subtercola boreus TaxID=120213 RepID=A0A3E0VKD9_9MICO|nr:DUF3263 domain-containing protein [Subtercola boreus]RFA09958.1 hypothetical protein B7R54_12660 [Subtercola boreus]TQL52900.1 uncharacterized protein DUF3263 [Subtercola boreus]